MSSHWYLKSISVTASRSRVEAMRETKRERTSERRKKKLNQLQPFLPILSNAVCVRERMCRYLCTHFASLFSRLYAGAPHAHIGYAVRSINANNRLGTWAIRNSVSPVGSISTPPHIGKQTNTSKKRQHFERSRLCARLHWTNQLTNQRVVLAFLNICNEQYFLLIRHFFHFQQPAVGVLVCLSLCLAVGAAYRTRTHTHTHV